MKSHKFCGLGLCKHINTARLYRYYFVSDIETFNVALDRVGLVRSQIRPECFKWFYCAEFQRNDLS